MSQATSKSMLISFQRSLAEYRKIEKKSTHYDSYLLISIPLRHVRNRWKIVAIKKEEDERSPA